MRSQFILALMLVANMSLLAASLYCFKHAGIDIEHTSFYDNAQNITFVFDYLAFIVAAAVLNILILSIRSYDPKIIKMLASLMKENSKSVPPTKGKQAKTVH